MTLDLWCLALVGIFGFTGVFQGASGQVARILALAAATAVGYWAGPWAGGALLAGLPAPVLGPLGALLVGFAAYLLLATLLRQAARRMVERRAWGKADRAFGFILGALQGVYLAWVLVLALPAINKGLGARGAHVRFQTAGSKVARFVAEHPLPIKLPGGSPLPDTSKIQPTLDRFKTLKLPGT
jgi:hypothetical protein